ncbi:hypothetical protein [Saccharomonospora iraqiensis]|uniref:hypothetical protein n=1 Tax=Saccharomonospora iraqiensis TaxID=52698 RepID=UPI00031715C9|nr:hypothetical protein [Saccharomonospora iraqiensis]
MNGPALGVVTAVLLFPSALLPAPAASGDSPGPAGGTTARTDPVGSVPEPEVRCSFTDDRLDEVSGLAARDGDVYAVNDGGTRVEVFVLDDACAVRDVLRHPIDPYDVEDLALGPDGTLWLGDTGDNRRRRETVALHAVPRGDAGATLYRLTYPDGPHDAEALVVDEQGVPHIITKDVLGASSVYRPAGPLAAPGPTPLEEVGTVSHSPTDTPGGPVGTLGSTLITGAALARDGSVLAVRTYTDAYLYPVDDGDLPAALEREPVRVPLPDEEQGESLAFTDDGDLVSVSEGVGSPLRVVPDAATLARAPASDDATDPAPVPRSRSGTRPEDTGSGGRADTASDGTGESGLATLPGVLVALGLAAVVMAGLGRLRRR